MSVALHNLATGSGPMDGPGRAPPGSSPEWCALLDRLLVLSSSKGMVLGLDRVARVLEALGHPERAFRAVHVAGSNGKGSTSAFTASILSTRGRHVGLYTSPHLVSLSERVQIVTGGEPEELGQDALLEAVERVERAAGGLDGLTFFEVMTLAGIVAFARAGVEIAVIEAGLGARLDATRLVEADVAVLTELSLEHCAILGDTLEKIAYEKSFVIRPGRPLVAADSSPGPMAVIEEAARAAGSPLYWIGRDLFVARRADGAFDLDLDPRGGRRLEGVELSLLGPHQGRNALLAAKAALSFDPTLTDAEIRAGLSRTVWPGRMEILPAVAGEPPILLDGAHNAQCAAALAAALRDERSPLREPEARSAAKPREDGRRDSLPPGTVGRPRLFFVFGVLSDKDAAAMIEPLLPLATEMILTRPASARGRAPAELVELIDPALRRKVSVLERPADALLAAAERARAAGGWVVVAGSLYLVGEVRAQAGFRARGAPARGAFSERR